MTEAIAQPRTAVKGYRDVNPSDAARFMEGASTIECDPLWTSIAIGRSAAGVEFMYIHDGWSVLVAETATHLFAGEVNLLPEWIKVYDGFPVDEVQSCTFCNVTIFGGIEICTCVDSASCRFVIVTFSSGKLSVIVRQPDVISVAHLSDGEVDMLISELETDLAR
jgi:hypothetical protein